MDFLTCVHEVTATRPYDANDLVCDVSPLDEYLAEEHNCRNNMTNDPVGIPFSGCDKIPVVSQTQDNSEDKRTLDCNLDALEIVQNLQKNGVT